MKLSGNDIAFVDQFNLSLRDNAIPSPEAQAALRTQFAEKWCDFNRDDQIRAHVLHEGRQGQHRRYKRKRSICLLGGMYARAGRCLIDGSSDHVESGNRA